MRPLAEHSSHLPAGHPEGLHDAFAITYRDIADAIVERRHGIKAHPLSKTYPDVESGAHMMKFIEACIESSRNGGVWTSAAMQI